MEGQLALVRITDRKYYEEGNKVVFLFHRTHGIIHTLTGNHINGFPEVKTDDGRTETRVDSNLRILVVIDENGNEIPVLDSQWKEFVYTWKIGSIVEFETVPVLKPASKVPLPSRAKINHILY